MGAVLEKLREDRIGDSQLATIALTDSSGVVQTTYSYGPFGQTATSGQSSDNPYQFVGHENDSFGLSGQAPYGVYNFRARYLDTATGRFVSSDPEGFAGGSHNLYSYANSNPLNMLDPTGMDGICAPGPGDLPVVPADPRPSASPFPPQDKTHNGVGARLAAALSAAAEAAQTSNSGSSGNGGLAPGSTGAAGGTVSATIGGTNYSLAVGFGYDSKGDLALFGTLGFGRGVGEGFSGGFFAQYSNGSTADLGGPFGQASLGIGAGSLSYFVGPSADGFVNGVSIAGGFGVGVSASQSVTVTNVVGLNY